MLVLTAGGYSRDRMLGGLAACGSMRTAFGIGSQAGREKFAWSQYASFPEVGMGSPPAVLPVDDGGMGAFIFDAAGSVAGAIQGYAGVVAALSGAGILSADATMLKEVAALLTGVGEIEVDVIGRAEISAHIKVNELTENDVAGAVLGAVIENGLSLREVIRVLLAFAAGKTSIDTGPPVVVTFRNNADTKDRITGEMDGSERVDITIDPTE
jgi:hypothetical protein